MWWRDHKAGVRRAGGIAAAFAAAALLTGCFEPLYGQRSIAGGPGIRERLSSVEVMPITAPSASPAARIAVEVRNQLIFDTTGGTYPAGRTHQLKIDFNTQRSAVIVDITSARPDVEQYGINATFSLIEIAT